MAAAVFAFAICIENRSFVYSNKTANLALADEKARQSSKIREIHEALITTGFISLDAQAKMLGLRRSTTWTILSAKHKRTGISAKIICRMLRSERLPPLVRAKIMEYAQERAAGKYGGTTRQNRSFASKLNLPVTTRSRLRG